jgi:hypothetical protein
MSLPTPASPLEGFLDEADARIMEVVYQWASINFGFDVGTWIQDSTEIRDILHDALSHAFEEGRKQGQAEEPDPCPVDPRCPKGRTSHTHDLSEDR